jgi:hypothetical protein
VRTLAIGELWALPAMLRLGLIESVRRMALRTVQRLDETDAADAMGGPHRGRERGGRRTAERCVACVRTRPPAAHADLRLALPAPDPSHRRQYPPLAALEQWIAEEGMSAEHAAALSTQRLALTQIVMAHSITSLRAIAGMDWKQVVERHSALEAAARGPFRSLPAHDVRDARPLPARGGEDREAPYGRSEGGRRAGRRRRWRTPLRPIRRAWKWRATSAITSSTTVWKRSSGRRLPAEAGSEALHRWMVRHANLVLGRRHRGRHGGGARRRALAGGRRRARGMAARGAGARSCPRSTSRSMS